LARGRVDHEDQEAGIMLDDTKYVKSVRRGVLEYGRGTRWRLGQRWGREKGLMFALYAYQEYVCSGA
jgi:hypothetical protein